MAVAAFADDQLRAVQQFLKDQGYYYGQADGQPGNDTAAAIKRFQIRNGLQVTGALNQETLAAINGGGGGASSPAAAAAPEIQPAVPDVTTVPAPGPVSQPPLATPPPATPVVPRADVNPYAVIFRKTPYENAPVDLQQSTVRRAQMKLYRDGFYRGPIDGAAGSALAQAVMRYQSEARLTQTGRLDMDTLASLDLLPRNGPARPGYYQVEPVPARPVYRGIWIH